MASRNRRGDRLTVLYDADCRVCTRIAARLAGADHSHRLRLRPLQDAAGDSWPSVRQLASERDLRQALHVIDEAGAWTVGGDAVMQALERLAPSSRLLQLARNPLLAWAIEPCYRWFARHRARFGWLAPATGGSRTAQQVRLSRLQRRVRAGSARSHR